jgi:transcriptional regulator with PAS, ATPase and Fis domain/CHASE2 domain-containing sensor protein
LRNKKQIIIQISIVLLATLFLLVFQNIRKSADNEIENIFIQVRGEISPDSNIILIHFSEEDIARIGPWPIKRNYYALLINQLSNLGVKKIGLEIFLSSRFVTQSVYDNLLRKEIEKSGKVVLSSVAGRIPARNNKFYTDSLSFPSPKLLDENLQTGHINFISDYDYEIPLVLINKDIQEKAFAYQISGIQTEQKSIVVNFISSWQKIRKYSALEFAELVYNKSPELNNFKDKIVILGISDIQIAPTIKTPFDDHLPGMALHFFALDNILNSRDFRGVYYLISLIVLPLLLFGFIFYRNKISGKIIPVYLVAAVTILIVTFVLVSIIYLKISTSLFIIPFVSLVIGETVSYFLQERKELKGAIDETTLLRNLLSSKEKELSKLQKGLNESGEESLQLVEKIETLRNDIEKLRENEDDRLKVLFDINRKPEDFFGIVYTSNSIAQIVELVKKAAPTDSTILITGESGTGKELVARAIHSVSKRKNKNFIAVNCGALTDSILESELFGHVRGSFTGATTDKAGRFELADQGTIFLDEIGETSENFQVKMLRVLQSGEIEKVGSTKVERVNVRVVAATNKNIVELVKEKIFREDLYYRLNVITIELPPLRERKEDIDVLANSFLLAEAPKISLSKAVLQALNDYQWKGNVRELESVIKRAIIFARSEKRNLIQLSDLPKEIVKEARYSFEDLVLESLRNKKFTHSSIAETAKELGNVNRTMIAENLRGLALKTLVENEFNIEKTVSIISGTEENEVKDRVLLKVQTFINNIQKDVKKSGDIDFESLKRQFSSKYKNLPAKFHSYLDEVLKWKTKSPDK